MFSLIPYELLKIWRKRSFLVLTGVLLVLNFFLLWYVNMPAEGEVPLYAYKAVFADLSDMTEVKKYEYITQMKEKTDGISILSEILSMQARGDEMGMVLSEQMLEENPDIIETYMQSYQSGDYLNYTNDLYTEKLLVDEIYDEVEKVSGYDAYLNHIKESQETRGGISIFASDTGDGFSSQNIEKSATDHAGLSSENIRFQISKGIRMAMESPITDLLLSLSVFLFIGSLIAEEKEKGLFYITRATKNGISNCIGAKLFALAVHSIGICTLLYGANLIYAGLTAGLCDLTVQIQSISAYLESSLSITLFTYIVFSIVTKALLLFCLGAILTVIAICTKRSFVPQLIGAGILALNWIAYTIIPAYSTLNQIKYLSFFGMMKTEHLYGEYLNLNIAGNAVSRLLLAWMLISVIGVSSVLLSVLLFSKGENLTMQKSYFASIVPFCPHGSLWWHEAYKILFTNRGICILMVFLLLIGYRGLSTTYSPSAAEQYYARLMADLEGDFTTEKEALVLSERKRFDEAQAQVERIEMMYAEGEIDEKIAEDMKIQWYGVLTFYPAFERVLTQYEHIKADGGEFIYDTGYRYLFGTLDDSFVLDLLLLSFCMIFAFGNVMAMEEQKKSWYLLSATVKGKRQIIVNKITVCSVLVCLMTSLTWIFRTIAISKVYPMHKQLCSVQNLPMYFEWSIVLPIWVFIVISVLSQIAAIAMISGVVLLLSYKRKNYLQASFLSLLILVVPMILVIMGFDFAKWFSVYPIYSWMSACLPL